MARKALKKDAFEVPPPAAGSAVGKEGLNDYIVKGFVPSDRGNNEGVSRTLDFGFADFATAEAFQCLRNDPKYMSSHPSLGTELAEDIKKLKHRSARAVSTQFSPQHGLMAPMTSTHNVNPGFDPVEWGKGFVEGNSWHHSFPPYALRQLESLYGGRAKLLSKLESFMSVTSDFRVGSYGQEIHEMTEMRTLAMGQYGHNNQPCHHILYLFALLGEKALTEKYVREVLERGYGEDFYAGDEDNGEQGAWFVLSALGLYSAVPGTPDYVMNTPLFQHVVISRGDTAEDVFHIIAMGAGQDRLHTKRVYLNAKEVDGPTVSDGSIAAGGILQFVLDTPDGDSKIFSADDLVSVREESPAAGNYLTQIEKQKREINELRDKVATLKEQEELHHQYHGMREPVVEHKISAHGELLAPTVESSVGCGLSSTAEMGLVILCLNLVIMCGMLVLQIQRYKSSDDQTASGMSQGVVTRACSAIMVLPVLVKEALVSVVGIQAFQNVTLKSNKEKTYTV